MFTSIKRHWRHHQPATAALVAKWVSKVVFMGRNRGNKMCGSAGAYIKEPTSAFGSHQNQTMTLVCAKCKESYFKVGNKDGSALQYSVGSVWSLADHVQTQSRLGPLGLLDWWEAGISYVGQIKHSDQCPKTCIWKGQLERKLDLRKSRDYTCKIKTHWSPLKQRMDIYWTGSVRSDPVQAPLTVIPLDCREADTH